MADVLVVADDLTGANAAAAGFARAGFRAVTASAGEHAEVVAEMVSDARVPILGGGEVVGEVRSALPALAAQAGSVPVGRSPSA